MCHGNDFEKTRHASNLVERTSYKNNIESLWIVYWYEDVRLWYLFPCTQKTGKFSRETDLYSIWSDYIFRLDTTPTSPVKVVQ